MSEEEFDTLLLEAIDEGFSAIGESSKQAIYYHLETIFSIRKHEIICTNTDIEKKPGQHA